MRHFLLALILVPSIATAQTATYEQILVPFDTMTLPTGGALWRAELWVRNDGASPVNLWAADCSSFGNPVVCPLRIDVPPERTVLVDVREPVNADHPGVLLYVPRQRAGELTFNLRVRDLNQGTQAIGTDIPVVRESEMRRGKTTFINVPLQPNGRVDLRLYVPQSGATFDVKVYAEPAGHLLAERTYSHVGVVEETQPPLVPVTINAGSVFRGWIVDRVRVTVERTGTDAPYWPLLTITNRHNNQITVVTSQ